MSHMLGAASVPWPEPRTGGGTLTHVAHVVVLLSTCCPTCGCPSKAPIQPQNAKGATPTSYLYNTGFGPHGCLQGGCWCCSTHAMTVRGCLVVWRAQQGGCASAWAGAGAATWVTWVTRWAGSSRDWVTTSRDCLPQPASLGQLWAPAAWASGVARPFLSPALLTALPAFRRALHLPKRRWARH